MSKTETLRQSAAASNEKRIERLANQIETVRQVKHQSAEELAATLEPLAQAMAALTDETRQTLAGLEAQSKAHADKISSQISPAAKGVREAAAEAQTAAEALNQAGQRMERQHYILAVAIGLLTGVLVTVFWRWLAPPTVNNHIELDAGQVAAQIRAATAPQKPSSGR